MYVLTVFSHPLTDKYPAAVMESLHIPFRQAGHTIDVLDLHREGFDPRFTEADHAHFWGGPIPPGIAEMHRRVEAADRFAYCGINDVQTHLIYDVEGDHNSDVREAGLRQARDIGTEFISPNRVPRTAKEEHLRRRAESPATPRVS